MTLFRVNVDLWLWVVFSAVIFGVVVTAGGAIFYLAGAPLAWLYLPLSAYLLGICNGILYPPRLIALLIEILDSLNYLNESNNVFGPDPTQPEEYHPTVEEPRESNYGGMPIIVYNPFKRNNWTGYIVIIRTGDNGPIYVRDWNNETATINYTDESNEAFCFYLAEDAATMCRLVYVMKDRNQRVEAVPLKYSRGL